VVTVKHYLTPDLSEPRHVTRFDRDRLTWIDLTPTEQAEVVECRRRELHLGVVLAAIGLFLVWVLGQVFVGEPALDPIAPSPTAAYVHPAPIERAEP
jgi:hypothetical protein